jgi:hypothetical protein
MLNRTQEDIVSIGKNKEKMLLALNPRQVSEEVFIAIFKIIYGKGLILYLL